MKPATKIPPLPPPPRPPMTPAETLYYRYLVHWYRFRKRAPSMQDMCDMLAKAGHVRTKTPIYAALCVLENKGYVRRNLDGQFEVAKVTK